MSISAPVAADAPAGVEFPVIPPAWSGRHVASLDGLRCVAILGVLFTHAGVPGFAMGGLGVDLFFVLSGFLITTLLVEEQRRTGTVSLPKFWARRFLRLMPAYWLYAGFITYAIFGLRWGWTDTAYGWDAKWFVASIWLYFVNNSPWWGLWEHRSLTIHLWSLSVEEQFYFAWPPLFWFCIGRRHLKAEWVAWGIAFALIVPYWILPVILYDQALLQSRGAAIVVGCAFALTAARSSRLIQILEIRPVKRTMFALAVLAFLIPTGLSFAGMDIEAHARWTYPLFALAVAPLVVILWHGTPGPISRALSWAPLVYVGKISYGIYLYHQVARGLTWASPMVHWTFGGRAFQYGLKMMVYLSLSILLATISYYTLERPFLRLKSRFR